MGFGGIPGVKAGLKVRIAQQWVTTMKQNLLPYASSFLNMDYKLEPDGEVKWALWPFYTTFKYSNVKNDPIKLDL